MSDDSRVKPAEDQRPTDQQISDQTQQAAYPPLTTEQKEAVGSLYKEGEPAVIEKKEFETPAEVKKYVKEVKKEEAIKLPVPVEDEYGRVLMESARPSKPRIILPLNQTGMKQAVKKKITDSIRWLATWCLRLIKMFPGRVVYKNSKLKM